MLIYQIRASLGISFVFIALQVTQVTSSKNSRIFWKMLQQCKHNFTMLAILVFTWIHQLQQLPRLMISWHHSTQNNMSISQHTYMDIGMIADGLSDHNTVIADIKVPVVPVVYKHNVFYRAIHSINIASFMTNLITPDLVTFPKEHVSDLYKQYRQILKTLFDKHAPIKYKYVSQKPPAPWMTTEIIQSKRRRRYLERVWRKSRSSLATRGNVIYLPTNGKSKVVLFRKYGLK